MISWTATRIDAANYCRMRYYLRYVGGETPLKLSAYVKGSFLHSVIEKFWEKLGTPEEVAKKSSGKKYSNEQEFAKYARGLWMRLTIGAKKSGEKIAWRYEGEEYATRSNLYGACIPLFHCLMNEGPPLFSEIGFDFIVEGTRFKGRIDDVRMRDGQVIIRDYKSGRPWIGEMKINNDPQLTIYNAGLCSLCLSNDKIAEKLGLIERRKDFMRNGSYVCPDFVEQFFMIEAPIFNAKARKDSAFHPLKTIHETRRKDEHFLEVLKMINGIEKAVNEGEIYPERGRKCDDCDLKYPCEKKLDNVGAGHLEDEAGQGFFNLSLPAYARRKEEEKDSGQIRMRYRFK
jgi:hypothetical protein